VSQPPPEPEGRDRRNGPRSRGPAVAVAGGGFLVGAVIALLLVRGGEDRPKDFLSSSRLPGVARSSGQDPYAFDPAHAEDYEVRAAAGSSHVLFSKSPGGVLASARRTDRLRPLIEDAASGSGVDPDMLEAIVFLESAGRAEVIAGNDPQAATGLTQILAETGQNLLDMRVDLAESRRLTKRIERAEARGRASKARVLRRRRARVDERFDARKSLEAGVRYLELAKDRFGREDLAIASYHMGIGNLTRVIRTYVAPDDPGGGIDEVVRRHGISYAKLFFDSSPLANPRTQRLLSGFGDDSSTYLWRVLAAREIMRLYRKDREELRRLAALHGAKASSEEVFHPRPDTEVFDDPDELSQAREDGDIVDLPSEGELARDGLRLDRNMGELAGRLDQKPELYRGLRPEALATLLYLGRQVRRIAGPGDPLIVTSTVRDRRYQKLLVGRNPEATSAYSLHTAGWSFDVLRRYRNRAQARAFQFVLDRLRALAVIDYVVEPEAIHITVSDQGKELLPLLRG
jgi:transglycosylase-like protein with SLT domain